MLTDGAILCYDMTKVNDGGETSHSCTVFDQNDGFNSRLDG